jgi:predicted transcriptional regulator
VDGFPPAPAPHAPVWLTEDGLYLPPAKVRRIRLAQDALSAAEEMVYDLLWSQKPGGREEAAKTVQAGYDFIMKRTRLSKKTVQRIIDKLIDKGFIEIETPADIYRRTATTYRVFNYKTILERQAARNRFYVAKIGPGMVYVRQVARPSGDMTTVVSTLMSTVADSHTATVDKPPTVGGDNSSPATVARRGLTTVVRRHTPLEEQTTDKDGQPSSSDPVQALVRALAAYGPVDDDGARYLLAQCRRAAPDCTGEEILHFIEAKGEVLRLRGGAVRNAVGFLLSAVPKCFSGETLRIYREEVAKEREQRLRLQREAEEEVAALRAEQEGILNDPASSEEDRRWARRFLEQGW